MLFKTKKKLKETIAQLDWQVSLLREENGWLKQQNEQLRTRLQDNFPFQLNDVVYEIEGYGPQRTSTRYVVNKKNYFQLVTKYQQGLLSLSDEGEE